MFVGMMPMSIRYFLVLGLLTLVVGANAIVANAAPRSPSVAASVSPIQMPGTVEEGKQDSPPRGPKPAPGPRDGGDGDR